MSVMLWDLGWPERMPKSRRVLDVRQVPQAEQPRGVRQIRRAAGVIATQVPAMTAGRSDGDTGPARRAMANSTRALSVTARSGSARSNVSAICRSCMCQPSAAAAHSTKLKAATRGPGPVQVRGSHLPRGRRVIFHYRTRAPAAVCPHYVRTEAYRRRDATANIRRTTCQNPSCSSPPSRPAFWGH